MQISASVLTHKPAVHKPTNQPLEIPSPISGAIHELKPHFHEMDGEQEISNESANSSETFSYLPWHISYPGQKDSTSPLR